ncbi:MAG: hypothetical protein AABO58_07885 [Acidobacteriota bacterium]
MSLLIDHALVTDTDHLTGGGGYAVEGVSPDVTPVERAFVADNFGISGYLHDPSNARDYFSFFRIPNGRLAFVRRFANGTRRNGVQNRLFIHTMFLYDDAFAALHGLPWLLVESTFRNGKGAEEFALTKDVEPLLKFLPLQIQTPLTVAAAHQHLNDRLAQFERRAAVAGGQRADEVIASAMAAIGEGRPVVLPQDRDFELVTLLAWSMLPLRDRFDLAWTQHDSRNLAGITFDIANAPEGEAADLTSRSGTDAAQRLFRLNQGTARDWYELHDEALRRDLTIRRPELSYWLRWREALAEVMSDPTAPNEVLRPRLERLASTVRLDRRDPWVDELALLKVLWSGIGRAIESGESKSSAVNRWVGLMTGKIGDVIFRKPPTNAWLDESERQIGRDLLVDAFLRGTETRDSAAATREALASWLISHADSGAPVETAALVRLLERLALDRSSHVEDLLRIVIRRSDGFAALVSTLPASRPEFADVILLSVLLGLNAQHRDTGNAVRKLLIPQLLSDAALAERIPQSAVLSIATLLRDEPAEFLDFGRRFGPATIGEITKQVTEWFNKDRDRTRSLARELLDQVVRRVYPQVQSAALALAAAAAGEPSRLWLPIVLGTATSIDDQPDHSRRERFLAQIALITNPNVIDSEAASQIVDTFVSRAKAGASIGPCMRQLLRLSSRTWASDIGRDLADVTARILKNPREPIGNWEFVLTELLRVETKRELRPEVAEALTVYWERADERALAGIGDHVLSAIPRLTGAHRDRVLRRWLGRVSNLPRGSRSDELIRILGSLLPADQRWRLTVPLAERDLELGTATIETLARLDAVLLEHRYGRESPLEAFIARMSSNKNAVARAVQLIGIAVHQHTLPSTRSFIETDLLDAALSKVPHEGWPELLSKIATFNRLYEDEMYLLQVIARRAGAVAHKSPAAVEEFRKQCRRHHRRGAYDAFCIGLKPIGARALETAGRQISRVAKWWAHWE